MTKDDVLKVIQDHFADVVDDVEAGDIDPAKSMKDYGATSLDMIEVVSASMRQLKVKIPRSELNGIEDIAGLVDALYDAHQAKAAA